METSNNRRHVLVVDEDERIVEEIRHGLSHLSAFQVSTCTSGQAAREALQQSKFDLLITDWKLPDVDGLTLIRETQARTPETVTVLMAAFGSPESLIASHSPYAHHYIEKPFRVEELVAVINSIFPAEPTPHPKAKPLVLKVVLGGDAQVGKTSLIQRYCTGRFDPLRMMTIGVDFHLYDLQVDQTSTRIMVWDMGGQERFAFARRAFYRGTQAVGLVFDASNRTSFYNLTRWWRETREFLKDVPILLLANKIDLPRQVSTEEMALVARAWNIPYYESSCASGAGVAEFFEALAATAVQNTQRTHPVEMATGE
jgi:small GTP-binding protein